MGDNVVILDNGHGKETPGKCSPVFPNGVELHEYEFNRDVVRRIAEKLKNIGISYRILVPEENDISLSERCKRANQINKETNGNCFLLSIHANAGGGTGWEIFTSRGGTKADVIASVFAEEAKKMFGDKWKMRFDYSDGDADKEADFYILKHTICPAVLTENFFMDTEKDCRFIVSESGREQIAQMHVNAIKKIIDND